MPLADKIRPRTLEEVVGQKHLLGEQKPLRKIIESRQIPNMIFYGPSGVGKTTVANIIAEQTNMNLHRLNGTQASVADIKQIIAEVGTFMGQGGILLYLDEIQYLNKKQQQSLLEFIETGEITLIASTTENPYFYVYSAILSRCTVFSFSSVRPEETIPAIRRGFAYMENQLGQTLSYEDEAEILQTIASGCGGDVRKSLNTVELAALSAENGQVLLEHVNMLSQKSAMRYDRDGDRHYDIMSAFQKSIRGSDENAALYYLACLLEAGDMASVARRMLVTAAEDIGLAYPQAIITTKACVDAALQLGLPEARIPLAEAVILLCTAPKSNSAICAIDAALADVRSGRGGDVPPHLKDSHYAGAEKLAHGQGYCYAHNYKNHYVRQQYLPDALKGKKYYTFGDNKLEQAAFEYRKKVIAEAEEK